MKKLSQNFHICLHSGPRRLTSPPPSYGQPDRKISVVNDLYYLHQLYRLLYYFRKGTYFPQKTLMFNSDFQFAGFVLKVFSPRSAFGSFAATSGGELWPEFANGDSTTKTAATKTAQNKTAQLKQNSCNPRKDSESFGQNMKKQPNREEVWVEIRKKLPNNGNILIFIWRKNQTIHCNWEVSIKILNIARIANAVQVTICLLVSTSVY